MNLPLLGGLLFVFLPLGFLLLWPHAHRSSNGNDRELQEVDGRRINGHVLETNEDWDRWWVKKGFTDGLFRHLKELEQDIESIKSDHAADSLSDWHRYYKTYREVCLECGIWNQLIGDREPFVASEKQISMENDMIDHLSLRYNAAEEARETYRQAEAADQVYKDVILDYIQRQPGHVAKRYDLLQTVSFDSEIPIERARSIYKSMVSARDLLEKKDGRIYVVKVARKKAAKPETGQFQAQLPPSVYTALHYSQIDRKTIYKVEYTVGHVQNLDSEANRGEFVSLTSGARYYTSLTKCTCPAYSDSLHPCKHMVALAIELGYYDPRITK